MRVLMGDDSEPLRKRICERIRAIPTLIESTKGQEGARQSGAQDLPSLLRWIEPRL